jgi:hypothetical protein
MQPKSAIQVTDRGNRHQDLSRVEADVQGLPPSRVTRLQGAFVRVSLDGTTEQGKLGRARSKPNLSRT